MSSDLEILKGKMVRRLKKDVLSQLPAKRRQVVFVDGDASSAVAKLGDAKLKLADELSWAARGEKNVALTEALWRRAWPSCRVPPIMF